MEIKIPKEIRQYEEGFFLGLSLRQCLFGALAIAVAVAVFVLLQPMLGLETVSWVCVLAAAPFAFAVFFRYHGMTFVLVGTIKASDYIVKDMLGL